MRLWSAKRIVKCGSYAQGTSLVVWPRTKRMTFVWGWELGIPDPTASARRLLRNAVRSAMPFFFFAGFRRLFYGIVDLAFPDRIM